MNKQFKFQERIISDTFLSRIESKSIRNEILSLILESYTFRVEHNISQKDYAKQKELSLITLKRIELGECYNLILISKYINNGNI